jgi:hypothetical protein
MIFQSWVFIIHSTGVTAVAAEVTADIESWILDATELIPVFDIKLTEFPPPPQLLNSKLTIAINMNLFMV